MPRHAPLSLSSRPGSTAYQQERLRTSEPNNLATADDEAPLRLDPEFAQRTTVLQILNTRQPPSCDNCRTRKLGCSGRPASIEITTEGVATSPCSHCREWDLECSYTYQRKRRGRKNKAVEQLAIQQKARKLSQVTRPSATTRFVDQAGDARDIECSGVGYPVDQDLSTQYNPVSVVGPTSNIDTYHQRQTNLPSPVQARAGHLIPWYSHPSAPSQSAILGDIGLNESTVTSDDRGTNSRIQQPTIHLSVDRHENIAEAHSIVTPSNVDASPYHGVSPSTTLSNVSLPVPTNIESVLPRHLALHVISLYFEHVYCIIPVIHRPSFEKDLSTHEELRRPMFFALIMSIIAATLIHLPKSYFPIPAHKVRPLSDRCLKACCAVTRNEMENYNVDLICIKYFLFVVHNKHGNIGLEASAFGEAQYLAITMGLHREDTYYHLDPINAERGRRVWYLIYNADKFEAVSRQKPVLLRMDEFMGPESTAFPAEVDDECITSEGILPSRTPAPLISGFNTLARIVTILGDILISERDLRRQQTTDPEDLLSALRGVRRLGQRIRYITDTLPRPFQLEVDQGSSLPEPGWEDAVRGELDMFFSDPPETKDGYLVLKGNIHVTLAMTRLRLILLRENLLNCSGQPGTSSRNAAELVAADIGENTVNWRHSVYQDLYNVVHCVPIRALAANGPSLVTKIRVVAVTLLDALETQDETIDPNIQGIATYLLSFLDIMSSIESQFAD
ncbi:hypothetical protein I314_02186 [Cryptococcus bacillisporus CA1873]|uniref:Zn(2)-C6 fungal-type domain-containing protein n=1 Tax=Cryptococcus bacillisporus CA1873 TaxID=1296111 RepID=A0ABR5BF17_CRYGA|nr:hypothetical protein I314_02186 [Cryptococcus bacillisporus CA1873]|eukprot:KIR67769.1 hypothetical protein I314_02186 [Cryptococcus gattii CA1873]